MPKGFAIEASLCASHVRSPIKLAKLQSCRSVPNGLRGGSSACVLTERQSVAVHNCHNFHDFPRFVAPISPPPPFACYKSRIDSSSDAGAHLADLDCSAPRPSQKPTQATHAKVFQRRSLDRKRRPNDCPLSKLRRIESRATTAFSSCYSRSRVPLAAQWISSY
jgi:hypothetical protein